MVDERVVSALTKIDNRVSHHSIPLYLGLVAAATNDTAIHELAKKIFRATLRGTYLYDFYYETGNGVYLEAAKEQMEIVYAGMGPEHSDELRKLWNELLEFFQFEKVVWAKQKGLEYISEDDIRRYMDIKSSDAIFYAEIVERLTGADPGQLCYANMKLLDIMTELTDYRSDFRTKQPNLLVMLMLNRGKKSEIPGTYSGALRAVRYHGGYKNIMRMVEDAVDSVSCFDFDRRFALAYYPVVTKADWIVRELGLPKVEYFPPPY